MKLRQTKYIDQDSRPIHYGDILHLSFSHGHERDSTGDIYGDFVVLDGADGPYLKRIKTDDWYSNEESLSSWSGPDSFMKEKMEDGNPYGTRDYRFKIIGNVLNNPELLG